MLLLPDPKKEPRTFRIERAWPMGVKRGRGRNSFIDGVVEAVDEFYTDAVQQLKAWTAAPPRMRAEPKVDVPPEVSPELASTSLSSQDGSEEVSVSS